MRALRRIASLLLVLALTAGLLAVPAGADSSISVTVDGAPLTGLTVQPEVSSGCTMVPLRAITEALGSTVGWNSSTKAITVDRAGTHIELAIWSKTATVNGTAVQLDAVPYSRKGVTLVPVRFLAEALGEQVTWNSASRTVAITGADTALDGTGLRAWFLDLTAIDTARSGGDTARIGGLARTAEVAGAAQSALLLSADQIYDREELLAALAARLTGKGAKSLWTCAQVGQLAGWGYLAGYLTYEEVMAYAARCYQLVGTSYSKWDTAISHYLSGCSAATGSAAERSLREQYYAALKKGSTHYRSSWTIDLSGQTARLEALWTRLGLPLKLD